MRVRPGNPPSFNPPRFHLLTLNEDGSGEHVVLRTPTTRGTTLLRLSDPSWSPDGERIAYEREGPARFTKQLMIVPSEGGCAARIAGDAAISDVRRVRDYGQPAWRPATKTSPHPELECEEDG